MPSHRNMSDTVAGLRRQARRLAASATAKAIPAPTRGAADPTANRLLVLVSVAEAEARALTGIDRPGWTTTRAGQLRGEDGRKQWAEVAVVAGSLAELRRILPWLVRAGQAGRVTFAAVHTDRPQAVAIPTSLLRNEITAVAVRRPTDGTGGPLVVTLDVAEPIAVQALGRVVLRAPRAAGGVVPAAGLRLGLTSADALVWAAGDSAALLVGAKTKIRHPVEGILVDLLIGPDLDEPNEDIPHLYLDEGLRLPPVDTVVVSPSGFEREPSAVVGRLTLDQEAGSFVITTPGVSVRGEVRVGMTENHIAALRELRGVQVTHAADADRWGLARLLSQLACAGVPTAAPGLPAEVADALGPVLTAQLACEAADWADTIAREDWSVTTRRAALSRFAAATFWAAEASRLGRPTTPAPSVSALLTTRRAANLPFALAQLARQDWPELETVLVLHGLSRDTPGVAEALAGFDRPVTVVEVDAAVLFGVALDRGLRHCTGRLVTKIDDDDWYGPHHVTDQVQAHAYSGATMIGTSGFFAYLHNSDVTIRWTNMPPQRRVKFVHGGTILMSRDDMLAFGGWKATARGVDAHMIKMIQASGAPMYSIHDLGFLYYRGQDHTWMPEQGDQRWLAKDPVQWPGFHPPPQLHPLPHPAL
jgi:Glycosyl transferase family 2